MSKVIHLDLNTDDIKFISVKLEHGIITLYDTKNKVDLLSMDKEEAIGMVKILNELIMHM